MATRTVQLRTADARDIDAVDRVMVAAFDPRYGEAWTRSQALGVLAMPGVRLTLALVDDSVAGFAMIRSIMDEAELLLLAVDPVRRRAGLGGSLLRAVEADCAARGIRKIHLEVRSTNPAVRLYANHGFDKIGERPSYYRGREGKLSDAHTYSKALGV
jgi:ribosomal-protein-alanine N-acetyltransferase